MLINLTIRPIYSPETEPIPIVQEAEGHWDRPEK